jgi:hypothetical protein
VKIRSAVAPVQAANITLRLGRPPNLNATHPKSNTVERMKVYLAGELGLMTDADLHDYWKQVPWPKPNLSDWSKSAYVRQPRVTASVFSPLRYALTLLPPETIQFASKQTDPFGWLLKAINMTEWVNFCRAHHHPWLARVWLAAASQLLAERRLIMKAHGWADTWDKLRESRTTSAADDFYIARLNHDHRGIQPRSESFINPRLAKARQDNDQTFLRRYRRAKQHAGKRAGVGLAEKYLVVYWLELPQGFPGLCFFSDLALHSFLTHLRLRTADNTSWPITQIRLRLGLIQAAPRGHLITGAIIEGKTIRLTTSICQKSPYSVPIKNWPR